MIKKIGEIEQYIISDETKKLTNKQKMELAEKMFKEKYQGKVLTYKKLEDEMFVIINRTTRKNFPSHMKREGHRIHNLKLSIACQGHYIELIKSPQYYKSLHEKKKNQSEIHSKTKMYHYFGKQVLIDRELYTVLINVAEKNNGKYYIHFVEIMK